MAGQGSTSEAGVPRWAKVMAFVAVAAVGMAGALVLAGHGPGSHMAPTPADSVVKGAP